MSFWSNVNPVRAIRDLREQLATDQPHRWRILALAAAVTVSLFLVIFQQGGRAPPKPHKVLYFPSFLPGRSDAEIVRGNIEATRNAKLAEAEQEAREDRVRKLYKAVGDATGVETERAYREGTAQRAAEKARIQREREALLKGHVVKQP